VAVPDPIWVLDASVAIKWFFTDELLRDEALAVRRELVQRPARFAVPHLFLSEVIHVLARKSAHDHAFVEKSLSLLLRFGLRTIALDTQALQNVARHSCRRLSGYDATYLALAQQIGGRWLTADDEACRQEPNDRCLTLAQWTASA
jgi:predicted nucleic acid-binding protein